MRIARTTIGSSISAMTRIGLCIWGILDVLRNSLKTSVMPLEIVAGAATFAARALRLRLEYHTF